MRKTKKHLVLIGIAVVLAVELYAKPLAQMQDFQIPGHGSLRLAVPDGWQIESRALKAPASVTLHFTPKTGASFDIQITAVWLDANQLTKTTVESLRERAEQTAKELLPQSIEKVVTVQKIQGAESLGHFYALTDRNPAPGEFKYLTQGMFLTGEVLSVFTILHRVPGTPEVAQAVRMFTDSTYLK